MQFALTFATVSAALGWLFWTTSVPLGAGRAYDLQDGMYVVPVVGVMIAATGFAWRKRLIYALATLAVYVVALLIAEATGLNESVGSRIAASVTLPPFSAMLYMAFLWTFPLAMLLLFVGRTPSLLWGNKSTPR